MQRVLLDLLPTLRTRWATRQRPLPASVVCAQQTFDRIFVVDSSTLEALFCKLKALQTFRRQSGEQDLHVIDLATRLPEEIWFTEAAQAHDTQFVDQILGVRPGADALDF